MASKRRFLPLRAEMLKFLVSSSSCKTFQVRIPEQRSTRDVRTRKRVGKPNAEWLVRERIGIKWNSEKSLGCLNCVSFLTGLSPPFWFVWLLFHTISELIHLARCVKFNPKFNPWMVLIELRGTEFNRRTNLFRGLGRFNRGLALIGFRTTGAWDYTTTCCEPASSNSLSSETKKSI